MKRFINLFISFTVLLLLSCSNGFNTKLSKGSLSITLPWSQPRAAWLKSDITEYKVTLLKDTDSFEPQTKSSTPENPTITFDELETGEYTVKVLAYNNETEIAAGQTKVVVIEGETTTANVRMSLYQTKGGDEPEKDDEPVDNPSDDNPTDDDTLKFDIPFFAETLEDTKFYKVIIPDGDEPLDENDPFNKLPGKSYVQIKNEQNAFMDGMIFPGFNINLYTPSENEEEPGIKTLRENFQLSFATHDFIILMNPEDEDDMCMLFTEYGYSNYIKNPDSLQDIFGEDELIPSKIDYLLPYSTELINKKLPQLYSKLYDAYKDEEKIPNLWELSEEQLDELDIAKISIAINFLGTENLLSSFYVPEGDFEPKPPVSLDEKLTYVLCTDTELKSPVSSLITAKGSTTLYLGQVAPGTPDNPPETPETPKEVTVTFNCNYEGGPAQYKWENISAEGDKVIPSYNSIFTEDVNFHSGSREDKIDNRVYYFCGWSVGKTAEAPYESYTILQLQDLYQFTEDTTLYAVWCAQSDFEKSNGFAINYKLSSKYQYTVYFLNSHRDNFIMANVKLLFPEITLPEGILSPSWKASEGNELGDAVAGKTIENVQHIGTAEFSYTFSSASFAIIFYGNTLKQNGFHNEVITDFSNCDYIDGSFCYLLPREWDDFDNSLSTTEGCTFAGWSIDGDIVPYICLNNASYLTNVYANWEESEFLSTKYDAFYTINNLGDKKSDGTSEYFDFNFSTLDTGKLSYTYAIRASKMILQKEQSKYITDDDTYELWYELYLENGGYPTSEFNNIRIDYVTDNGIIFTASVGGTYTQFYLATQAQYNAALEQGKLIIISEKPTSTLQIDEALKEYNAANP